MTRVEAHKNYYTILKEAERKGCKRGVLRELIKKDPFFRLTYALNIVPSYVVDNDWAYARAWEVERAKWGYVDLWPREHLKTTIITENGTIGDVLNDSDATTCLFSFNRPIAKKIMAPVIQELETNVLLKELFPDILWADAKKQAPKWSEDEGYVLKRRHNPKEPTIMTSGLVDGQPTSMHFQILRYDDVETLDTARTPEMLDKTDEALRMSYNLGVTNGGKKSWVGTIYAYNDIYMRMVAKGTAKERKYKATKDGTYDGEPWLWTKEQLAQKIKDYGPFIAACQLFLEPAADEQQSLKREWLKFWNVESTRGLNIYITVDPASSKKTGSDYTVMSVVGLGSDRNYYVIRQFRDRMNLKQRTNTLFYLHQQYKPIAVGYEKYGMQADIEHIEEEMERRNYRFSIIPLGGQMAKVDRIRRMVPILSEGRLYYPQMQPYQQYDQSMIDLTQVFLNDEYLAFPVSSHDDMLDSLSRILDPDIGATFPFGSIIDPLEFEIKSENYDLLWSGMR